MHTERQGLNGVIVAVIDCFGEFLHEAIGITDKEVPRLVGKLHFELVHGLLDSPEIYLLLCECERSLKILVVRREIVLVLKDLPALLCKLMSKDTAKCAHE